MAYLRKEKLLIEADVHTPLAPGAEPLKVPIHKRSIEANVRRLNIDVDRIVSIHGESFRISIARVHWKKTGAYEGRVAAKSRCESIASCRFAQVRLVCFFLRRASIGDGFLTLDEA